MHCDAVGLVYPRLRAALTRIQAHASARVLAAARGLRLRNLFGLYPGCFVADRSTGFNSLRSIRCGRFALASRSLLRLVLIQQLLVKCLPLSASHVADQADSSDSSGFVFATGSTNSRLCCCLWVEHTCLQKFLKNRFFVSVVGLIFPSKF